MKLVFEKRIELYKRYLKKDSLSDIDKLTLTNRKEWMSRLLNLVIEQELRERITELTKRVYTLGRHFILALSTHTLNFESFQEGENSCIRLFPRSTTYTFPEESCAILVGSLNC